MVRKQAKQISRN